jgi:CRISPR-associated protein Cmr5
MTVSTPIRTLSQRRAAHAWQVIRAVADERNKKGEPAFIREGNATEAGKKLGGNMKKLPTRIISAGLGQALAFLRAKGEAPLLEHALAVWLRDERTKRSDVSYAYPGDRPAHETAKKLLDELVNQWSPSDLRRHTAEALAYLPWLIRFAEAKGLMEGGEQS